MNIIETLIPEKNKAWHYKIHPYFTKQPSNIVGEYIRHYTKENDVVLDLFAGTGVTGIEALTNKRKAILFDLSPFACFISEETVRSPIDLSILQKEYQKIFEEIETLEEKVWSLSEKELENYKIRDWYPKKIKLPKNADFDFVDELFDKKQLIVFARLFKLIKKIENDDVRNQTRLTFSATMSRVNLTYMVSKTRGENRFGDGGPTIFGTYRYARPKEPCVLKVTPAFLRRTKEMLKAKSICNSEIGSFFNDENFKIYNDSATNILKYIKPESVDYIYTDPPYGAHISYLDLSTMWNAWLGFKVTDEIKQNEIIEGGDLQLSREHYLDMLFKSAKNSYEVLKDGSYLSLVFQHKDTNLWFRVLDCFRDIGFNPENMIHQPTKTTSMHKKKNPLNVFGDQIIVNFVKKKHIPVAKVTTREDANILYLIEKTAKEVITNKVEASSEEIQQAVLNELYLKNKVHKKFVKDINIIDILNNNFVQNSYGKWMIKSVERRGVVENLKPEERIFFVVTSLLREKEKVSFDEVVSTVNIQAANGHIFTEKDSLNLLEDIAERSSDGKFYSLTKDWDKIPKSKTNKKQNDLFNATQSFDDLSEHDKIIFKLAELGQKLGYNIHIGKTEQRKNPLLHETSNFTKFPFTSNNIKAYDKNKIEQIDITFLDRENDVVYAFEIETSTTVKSGLERFYSLLNAGYSQVASKGLCIIIPNSKERLRTLQKELVDGTFAGQPFYMERRVKYCFVDEIMNIIKSNDIKEIDDINVFLKQII